MVSPHGMDIDRNNVVWVALGSEHLASFNRGKCKGRLNGPHAIGQHCPEGSTLYPTPGPNFRGVQRSGSADSHYYDWVDQFDTLALGKNTPIITGNSSDSLRRWSSGLSFLTADTSSKGLDLASATRTGGYGPATPHLWDRRLDYGVSDFSIRYNLANSLLYELPFGKCRTFGANWSRPLDAILGGWQVGAINIIHSGLRLSCLLGSNAVVSNVNFEQGNCSATGTANPNSGPHSIYGWWNLAALRLPTNSEVFGNAGRNILSGPTFFSLDVSAVKNFSLTERIRLQLRMEGFNIFNRPVLGMPNSYLDSYSTFEANGHPVPGAVKPLGSFGTITNTAIDNRQIQFALKVIW